MTINLSVPEQQNQLKPRITVIGVGGAGGNAVNNMITSHLDGVEFVVANTDAQALAQTLAERQIQLGPGITHGLGAGSRPDIGRAAAEEAMDDLMEALGDAHMVFITAGMGGGTGTGAGPVIARLAREHGILTVGVVTKPFQFEGVNRMRIAEAGIDEMQQYVDTLIVIPNQNLFRIANEKTTFADAFTMADEVLHSGVRGVTDLMVVPGLINLDFADIRAVMSEMGKAMMGTGEAEGDERARLAAEAAISNPLLDDVSMQGARGVLINITGGNDMTLFEVDEAANRIGEEVDPDANIIFGSTMDSSLEGKMRVSVVATGIDVQAETQPRPVLKVYTQPQKLVRTKPAEDPASEAEEEDAAQTAEIPAAAEAGEAEFRESLIEKAVERTAEMPENDDDRPEIPVEAPPAAQAARAEPRPEPRLVAENDAFMPPPPFDPRAPGERDRAPSDPFKEADLVNGGSTEDSRRRSPNLFQRITNGVRDRIPAAEPPPPPPRPQREPTLARTAAPAAPAAPSALSAPAARPEPPLAARRDEMPAEPPAQARFAGVDPQDRNVSQQAEDDLLEIPAFLRRQAN